MFYKNPNQIITNNKILQLWEDIIKVLNKIKLESSNSTENLFSNITLDKISFLSSSISSNTSNAIEGVTIDIQDEGVKAFNTQLINNYTNALNFIKGNHEEDISLQEILTTHQALFSQTHIPFSGRWKTQENMVVDSSDRNKIIFKTVHSRLIPEYMFALVDWYNTDKRTHPLFKVGIFIFDFLQIHPFEDGNGRTSRLLTNYLLLNLGLEAPRVVSIEKYILKNIDKYYKSLKIKNQEDWFENNMDYTNWLTFFFENVLSICQDFKNKLHIKKYLQNSNQTKPIQIAILFDLRSNLKFYTKDLEDMLEIEYNISKDTLKTTLPILTQNNFITKQGNARATNYVRTFENIETCSLDKITEVLTKKPKNKIKV